MGDYTYDPLGLPQSQHTPYGTSHFHHDWLGSTTDLTGSTGEQKSRTAYDPYGQAGTATVATSAPPTPFGFAGQYNDPALQGKQYLRAREYDPASGRFNTRDPLATPANSPCASRYTYAAGAPTIYTDPTGLSPKTTTPTT
ncbi:RHS repeat-associated core domain-containing protein [Kitasatospora sp. NPDC088351]|uniref:RHS repeat-associated core domain-containing protein n=1 Tax=Kitasatospora sp. NPDC088351 TaxID=3155180 RepID=UPI00343DD529